MKNYSVSPVVYIYVFVLLSNTHCVEKDGIEAKTYKLTEAIRRRSRVQTRRFGGRRDWKRRRMTRETRRELYVIREEEKEIVAKA